MLQHHLNVNSLHHHSNRLCHLPPSNLSSCSRLQAPIITRNFLFLNFFFFVLCLHFGDKIANVGSVWVGLQSKPTFTINLKFTLHILFLECVPCAKKMMCKNLFIISYVYSTEREFYIYGAHL